MRLPRGPADEGGVRRLFATFVVVTVIPLLLIGAALNAVINRQLNAEGVQQGQDTAELIARTVVGPLVQGRSLSRGLTAQQRIDLQDAAASEIGRGLVLRMRLRTLDGEVVWSSDGQLAPEDTEARDAASGHPVSTITHLNADQGGEVGAGPAALESYIPIDNVTTGHPIGVLEIYLPYTSIARHLDAIRWQLTWALLIGLVLLWAALLGLSVRVGRRLRRSAVRNEFLATHDQLTGLANRAQFARDVTAAVAAGGPGRRTAVAVLDLDRFKEVNDTMGHANGDALLVEIAGRLRVLLRESDEVARLGGDEFGIVVPGVRDAGEVVEVMQRVRAGLAQPLLLDGLPVAVEASIGFALVPDDGVDVDVLLTRADLAMYVAKRKRLGIVHYRPEHEQYDATTLTLVAELGAAIERGELVLHYQPKADARSGSITAVEALVRWAHPTRGLLYPDAFLFAAEQTELVDPLTRWVLREALTTLSRIDPVGALAMAVNVSARSITRPEFADDVLDICTEVGVDPHRLILEVTETALIADPRRAATTLGRLHRAGVVLSIDDFGAGQTSLGYLASLPINELKIDKDFVLDLTTDTRKAAIVHSVIELGHSLGFTVTAEGVETEDVLDRLRAAHCDLVQGYLLARPMPLDGLRRLLADAWLSGAAGG